MNKITVTIIPTFFGIGFFPIASGTVGSFAAIIVWYLTILYFSYEIFITLFIASFVLSFITTEKYLKITKKHDPKEVVIDEVIGQWIPLLIIDINDISMIITAFLLFRFFDILKIYPINKLESIPGASGVILDDILAGIYSLIIVMNIYIFLF